MKIVEVEVDQLRPAPWNPRIHPDRATEKLIRSIESYGFTNPILAQSKTNLVIAGHARLKAAKMAGLKKVPVIYLDFDEARAKGYAVADNRLQDETEWDVTLLQDLLVDLDEFTGFEPDELKRLEEVLPGAIAEVEKGVRGPSGTEDECPKCGYRW